MAIYHFTVGIVQRSKGQSAVAKAAYNARAELNNENTGEAHDYTRASGLLFSGIFAPSNAPEWVHDREKLWSEVERRETRKNAQLARNIELSLPHELTDEQRERLLKDFVRENFVRLGMVADASIHAPDREGDERNHHAHILLTMREIGPDGFGAKMRELNSKEQLEKWRENWERTANRYLERHGHEARIDRRSLAAQGIDREPSKHLGPIASQLEREGIKTDRGDINREIADSNEQREMLKEMAGSVERVLAQIEREEAARRDAAREKEEREKEEKDRAGNLAATLFDRGGMASQQRDALFHFNDRSEKKAEAAQKAAEQQKAQEAEKQKTDKERAETDAKKAKEPPRQAPQKERTDKKQAYSQKEIMRDLFEKQFGIRSRADRSDDRERERER